MIVLAALLAASCGYFLAVIAVCRRYRRAAAGGGAVAAAGGREAVSILKPAYGAGPDFVENLRSHAAQDYPEFEILVGVDAQDAPARDAVLQLRREFPERRIAAVVCPKPDAGVNPKIAVLEVLGKRAAHRVWVVSDADIEAPPGWLAALAADLECPGVGLVTCLYGAERGPGPASLLEALWIDAEFAGQVLLARAAQGLRFALGAAMAFRRDDFEKVGGCGALKQFLGDDYILGEKFWQAGFRVLLSRAAVTTHLPRYGLAAAWAHRLRWARTIRAQRPTGHCGLCLTFGAVWALAALAAAPAELWPAASAALALRGFAASSSARTVGRRLSAVHLLLLPVVDCCALLAWLGSFASRNVTWAGRQFRLGRKGRIVS